MEAKYNHYISNNACDQFPCTAHFPISSDTDSESDGDALEVRIKITVSDMSYISYFTIELTQKSGGVIIMTAFAVHFLKEISRIQLLSAAKRLIVNIDKKTLQAFNK